MKEIFKLGAPLSRDVQNLFCFIHLENKETIRMIQFQALPQFL